MHGYRWPDSPRAQNTIEGLTAENHAPIAAMPSRRCCEPVRPSPVALRIHGESGVAEGSYDFWKAVFDGVKRCGRTVEIDLHAKGIDPHDRRRAGHRNACEPLAEILGGTSRHAVSPGRHSRSGNARTRPRGRGLMTLSEGARVFTRYGYADLLREDRKYTVAHRVFSGTQRILLWGDPAQPPPTRGFQFLRLHRRRSDGAAHLPRPPRFRCARHPHRLCGHAPGAALGLGKVRYWYRVWGRLLYNPERPPDGVAAPLRRIPPVGARVCSGSRQSHPAHRDYGHMPSAACDAYWPEIYWNQPLVGDANPIPIPTPPRPRRSRM